MGTLSPEKSCADRQRLVEELVKGRDWATQLQILVQNPTGDHGSASAEELATKILRTFTGTLTVLNSWESGEVCQIPATTQVGSPSCGDLRSVDSGESSKRPAVKDRRGCYKRRKTLDSWMKISPSVEDDYAWRKYGQKEILNAKFPRCYFRCTHKHDQFCQATKQVQRVSEDPIMYQTTYFGHHTCSQTLKASQKISDSDPVGSYLLNFEPKMPSEQCHPSMKEESKEEAQSDLSSLDSIIWPELVPLESYAAAGRILLSPKTRSDHEDVISSTVYSSASTRSDHHGLEDMESLMKSVEFESYFHFDQAEFLKACN